MDRRRTQLLHAEQVHENANAAREFLGIAVRDLGENASPWLGYAMDRLNDAIEHMDALAPRETLDRLLEEPVADDTPRP